MTSPAWLTSASRSSPWSELSVAVAGIGITGYACADGLVRLGCRVTVVDERDGAAERAKAEDLMKRGADVRLGAGTTASVPGGTQLVVTSPGWRPDSPMLVAAAAAGLPVWGEIELARRLCDPATAWLALTGTNGKTTTVRMLASMLQAAGLRSAAVGNVGEPVVLAALDQQRYDALAVELSSFQLHWTHTMAAASAAVLNIAPDHGDWYDTFDDYIADKDKIYSGVERARIYNVDDPIVSRMPGLYSAPPPSSVGFAAGVIGFTLAEPEVGMLGVTDGMLVDRAFEGEGGVELAAVNDVQPNARHNVANALAAAALARSVGVAPDAVRAGLLAFVPEPHRVAFVAEVDGVSFVNDSKATNPHAAAASLTAYPPRAGSGKVVWVAGGLAKSATFDELVLAARDRMGGAVLIGADRAIIADALARHAPDVPVIEVPDQDNRVMDRTVEAAASLARPGDTVLLAPACASMDMFANYAARGDAFAAAVRRHGDR